MSSKKEFEIERNKNLLDSLVSFYDSNSKNMNNNLKLAFELVIIYAIIDGKNFETYSFPDIMFLQQTLRGFIENSRLTNGIIDVYSALENIAQTDKYANPEALCSYILLTTLSKHGEEADDIIDDMLDSLNDETEFNMTNSVLKRNLKKFDELIGLEGKQ